MIKVLLVEDDQFIADMTGEKLTIGGFAVVGAATGAAALEKLETETPDVVLLDLDLPDISGAEILKKIRATGDLPVILFTNNNNPDMRQQLEPLQPNDWFVKATTDLNIVIARIRELVDKGMFKNQG